MNMSKPDENWVCPYCNRPQVISEKRHHANWDRIWVEGCEAGDLAYCLCAIVCANDHCRKLSLELVLARREEHPSGEFRPVDLIKDWLLLPASHAKPQPDYIPEPLRGDYDEACAIRDLSPKASATLARRCLQGMIRDFCGITKARLIDEIKELRERVEQGAAPPGVQPDTLDAIDHVRSIGNIGAHMEKDIDVIVDVDPDEAQRLIELIELLFEEWYVAREERRKRLEAIGVVAANKAQAKLAPPAKRLPPSDAQQSE
jgi:Domain of unknown function (DUF4145)